MKYTTREKLGHFNKLRAASHLEADLELLKKLDPKHPLLLKASGGKEKYEGDILYTLLDHTTACDIKDFRREFHKSIELKKQWKDFEVSFNEGLKHIFEKYGDGYVIGDGEEAEYIVRALKLETIIDPESWHLFIGLSISNIDFLGEFEEDYSFEELREDINRYITFIESAHQNNNTSGDIADNQETTLSEDQKVLGTKVSDYKTAQEPSEIEEKTKELIEKEDELDSRESELDEKESDLDEKESELDEKEQELTDKEQELEEKAAVVEKKSVSKKPNTQK